jgi:hypothetical protein
MTKLGAIYDEVVTNSRRLALAHSCLGLIAAFAYWTRPGTIPIPLRWSTPHYADVMPLLKTVIAWMPYLISFMVTKPLLSSRNPKATLSFVIASLVITASSVVLYLNLQGSREALSPILISVVVVLALVVTAGICSMLWKNDATY